MIGNTHAGLRLPEQKRGPHRSATPKDLHMKHSTIAALPQAHPFIHEGVVRLNPAQAGAVLRDCGYENNRDVERAQKHVAVLTEAMRRGLWLPRDQIAFANLGGKLILVNGHHRMAAQAASGVDIEWSVVIYPCNNAADVAALYARFDTNVRKRTDENIMSALGVADLLGVTPTIARSVWRAAPMLANNMMASKKDDDYLSRHIADDRLAVVQSYAVEARAFQDAFKNAHLKASKKLLSGSVTAVALVTLRARREQAMVFWRGMAENDGLRRGDPRATLLQWLQDNATRGSMNGYIYAAARAWNAFCEGKELTVIRMSSAPLRIIGTSYVVTL